MEERLVLKNIKIYTWYVALKEPLMWGPILVTSLIHLGKMTLQEIYSMEAVVLLGYLLLEIPSGALADHLGRRRTVILGSIFHFVSMALFMCIDSPRDVWVANILWVIGSSLCSGADDAILYDSLKENGIEYEYLRIKGDALSKRLLLTGIGSLAVGFLANIDLRLPLYLSIPGVFVSSSLTYYLTEPGGREKKINFRKVSFRELCTVCRLVVMIVNKLMKVSILFVANNKKVKWFILYSTLLGVASKVWFFTYNPYFELVELDIRGYGILFFFLNMIAWYFSKNAHKVKAKLGDENSLIAMLLCIGLPLLIMGVYVALFSAGMIVFQNVTRGLSAPFFSDVLHQQISSENRATIDSVSSAVNGLSQFFSLKGFELLLIVCSLPTSLTVLGLIVLVAGFVGIRKYKKIFI